MKRFSILIILRVLLIVVNVMIISWIAGDMRLFFNQIILTLVFVAQVWELIHYANHTNRELAKLFLAIKHGDFSITFNRGSLGNSFKELQSSLIDIIQSYKEVKIEREAQYQFLQMLVKQIQIGIISLQGENIILINPIAEKIVGIKGVKSWKLVQQQNPKVVAELSDDGKKIIEIKSKEGTKMLAVEVSSLLMMDQPYKLITLQDINSEIEQKELEAWHKLIRILTHEIMNSITPISSLSETMQDMLTDKSGNQKSLNNIQDDTIKDIRFSLNTIQKRSERLLDFVENYRKLSRVSKPAVQSVDVKSFLSSIENLMHEELMRQGIDLTVAVMGGSLTIAIDPSQIEQVIINLLRNSIHALDSRNRKEISLNAYPLEQQIVIEVTDTGKGIPENELKEIFIPFFSTKKEGSGIGLSLSKQIMSLHNGRIRVSSKVEEGTSFYLYFQKIVINW
jgi:signal transduction histidine kinase